MAGRLSGKVAIVTGASRGLGQFCAAAYAVEGARVAIVARSHRETNLHLPGNVHVTTNLIETYGGEALPVVCDVTNPDSVAAMVQTVLNRYGRIDILVNNAAVAWDDPISSLPPRLFEKELRVNVLGAFYCTHAVLPTLKAQGSGSIINVSATGGIGAPHFAATKRALETLSDGLAAELRDEGIAVNCLRPAGWVDTPGSLVRDTGGMERAPPQSYLEAAVLLAMQPASYTGHHCTDAEAIRDLGDRKLLTRFMALNPPYWRESLRGQAGRSNAVQKEGANRELAFRAD